MNYYPHNVGDYAKDTPHLSLAEHGAYRLLIDYYYATESPLPVAREASYMLLHCRTKQDRIIVDNLLLQFFHLEADGWHHKRCDAEILKYRGKSAKRSAAAGVRWGKAQHANASTPMPSEPAQTMQMHMQLNNSSHANQEPIKRTVSQPPVDNSTSSAAFAQKLRDLGVKVSDQNPMLASWSAMAPATLNAAIEQARRYKGNDIPAAYLASVIANPPTDIVAKGVALGVAPRVGESMDAFRERVERADIRPESKNG